MPSTEKKRILSLDVLRGMTVAGMILVNNAGGRESYPLLKHTAWNGLTLCDLVFPFFLFIMGISTYISLSKSNFICSTQLVGKILKRTILMMCIGWGIAWFANICQGDFFPFDHLRIWGVLQRIGLCYCVVSFIAIGIPHRFIPMLSALLLISYTYILCTGNGYVCDGSNVLAIVDKTLFGENHLYTKSPIDPEGFTSTLSAIAHTLLGFFCGKLLATTKALEMKALRLFVYGFIWLIIGLLFVDILPLNKRIWSPTFVLFTCGMASMALASWMYLIDVKGKTHRGRFFVIFGVNPLFLYVTSEILAIVVNRLAIKEHTYAVIHSLIPDACLASVSYAVLFTALLAGMGYLLYRKKIYIKL